MSGGGNRVARRLVLDPSVRGFEGLDAILIVIDGLASGPATHELESYGREVADRVRTSYDLETLKDLPELRAYRDFFWKVGIDPTKTRPAAEALIRRILQGKPLPRINRIVDAYNLASVETRIAIAAFDASTLSGDIVMRMARPGETFLGIGMDAPVELRGNEVVNADDRSLIAIYPYRDAAHTAVRDETASVDLMFCGVPGIPRETLQVAARETERIVRRFCTA